MHVEVKHQRAAGAFVELLERDAVRAERLRCPTTLELEAVTAGVPHSPLQRDGSARADHIGVQAEPRAPAFTTMA